MGATVRWFAGALCLAAISARPGSLVAGGGNTDTGSLGWKFSDGSPWGVLCLDRVSAAVAGTIIVWGCVHWGSPSHLVEVEQPHARARVRASSGGQGVLRWGHFTNQCSILCCRPYGSALPSFSRGASCRCVASTPNFCSGRGRPMPQHHSWARRNGRRRTHRGTAAVP